MKAIIEFRMGDIGSGRIEGAAYSNFNFQIYDGVITLQFHGHGKPYLPKSKAINLLKKELLP